MDTPDLSTVAGRVAHLRHSAAAPGERPPSARRFSSLALLSATAIGMIERGDRVEIDNLTARKIAGACVTARTITVRDTAIARVTAWLLFGTGNPPRANDVREGVAAAEGRRQKRKRTAKRLGYAAVPS